MFALAIHGGAGTILPTELTPEKEAAYNAALRTALAAGEAVLCTGGTALAAVEAAVIALEDEPLFNAGRGAVFTHTGTHELDASIMCGSTHKAGAVAGVTGVRNPVSLARAITQHSEHIMLCGEGAAAFARANGIAFADADYFDTPMRYAQLQQALLDDTIGLDHSIKVANADLREKKFGTVGAVALDAFGNIAAATSTGGMTNKRYGRVGDTPIIGAGTYADNATCAVSCTGHGEFFIKNVVAYDIACLMRYKGLPLAEAARIVVMDKLLPQGGEGGLIALDAQGNITLPFNSAGMYRGWLREGEAAQVAIF
jgi:L-asparaginase / beta-aspartyl-peptidase